MCSFVRASSRAPHRRGLREGPCEESPTLALLLSFLALFAVDAESTDSTLRYAFKLSTKPLLLALAIAELPLAASRSSPPRRARPTTARKEEPVDRPRARDPPGRRCCCRSRRRRGARRCAGREGWRRSRRRRSARGRRGAARGGAEARCGGREGGGDGRKVWWWRRGGGRGRGRAGRCGRKRARARDGDDALDGRDDGLGSRAR